MVIAFLQNLFKAAPSLDPQVQRRTCVRLSCRLPVECLAGGASAMANVLDIGEGGLRIETLQRLKPGGTVDVRYLGTLEGQRVQRLVPCRVIWVHRMGAGYQAGLAFTGSVALIASSWVFVVMRRLMRGARTSDDRRHPRCPTDLVVALETPRGTQLQGRIRDLSVGGALLESSVPMAVGSRVRLRIDAGPKRVVQVEARVVRRPRAEQGQILTGLCFDSLQGSALKAVAELVAEQASRWRTAGTPPARLAAMG